MDVISVIPRLAQRAGSLAFALLPDQLGDILGHAKQSSGVLINTTAKIVNGSLSMLGSVILSNDFERSQTISLNASGIDVKTEKTYFSYNQARNFGGLLAYLLSKWAFATVALAILLNRTQFYASSRVPVAPRWYARVLLYSIPIWTLANHIYTLLNVIRCQNSPQYAFLRYGSTEKKYATDYANENGRLHYISSVLLFWNTDLECCKSVQMIPDADHNADIRGSLSFLWPLFLSFCLSQFVETLSCSMQSRQPMPEAGMTIFEHSLAFAEAETMVSKELGLGLFGVPATSRFHEKENAFEKGTRSPATLTRAMILRRLNVPSEVILIALISALSHFSSSILAVFGIRARYRLFFTGCWALLYMLAFVWSMYRILLDPNLEDINILRFPTVCIVGFIPHILVLIGICACAGIYFLAFLITAISPPPGIESTISFTERMKLAYSNLQANVHLSASTPLNIDLHDDFYTTLLKTGITILTTASEAVYMKESITIRANKRTWLEEKRTQEVVNIITKIRAVDDNQKEYINTNYNFKDFASFENKLGTETIGRHTVCGYARERKTRIADPSQKIPRISEGESGVGLHQRRGMWRTTFEFAKAVFILGTKFVAKCMLSILDRLKINFARNWLSNVTEHATDQRTFLGSSMDNQTMKGPRSSAFDKDMDVEIEARKTFLASPQALASDEGAVSQGLYNWWKAGGWWGEADSSGEFEPSEAEDDATSNISTATSNGEADEMDDGLLTPTRPEDCRSERAVSADPDTMLDTNHLALLLDPKNVEQQEEARFLACHLTSKRTVTRSQYRLAQLREKSSILVSSGYLSTGLTGGRSSALPFERNEDLLLESYILERRQHMQRVSGNNDHTNWKAGAAGMGSSGPQCVVCQQKPRTVLIWPCGCLSLCDDCRLGLATRNYSNCVCCRSDVNSYSRLYVP